MINPKNTTSLTRRALEVKISRVLRRLIPIFLAAISVLVVTVYVVSVMYTKFGGFTISVNKYHEVMYGLSLSESQTFNEPTSQLSCRAVESITNIDGRSLDNKDLGALDGNDSGANYMCYTFYCKNTGESPVNYEYTININNMTLGIEKAVRIRVITSLNGEEKTITDYARAAGVDENGNSVAEPNTESFYNKTTAVLQNVNNFQCNDVMKYTIVIWLEGNDPDCVDNIIGGEFKIDMKFTVLGLAE